jgi:hypothetical protein
MKAKFDTLQKNQQSRAIQRLDGQVILVEADKDERWSAESSRNNYFERM